MVLFKHVRAERYEIEDELANKMVSDIIDQLRTEQCIIPGDGKAPVTGSTSKRPRGRPRRQEVLQPILEDLGTGPRTRQRNAGALGMLGLLAAPAFTTSPVKSDPKQVSPIQFFIC